MTKEHLARIELLQGTLDLIVLQTLRWGPMHGYGISQMIRYRSNDLLQVETGSLYRREARGAEAERERPGDGDGRGRASAVCEPRELKVP